MAWWKMRDVLWFWEKKCFRCANQTVARALYKKRLNEGKIINFTQIPTLKFFFTCYFILLYHTLKIYLPKNGNAGIHYYLAATLFSYSFFSFVRSWEKANFQGWMTFSRSSRSSYFVRNFESNYTLHIDRKKWSL